MNVDPYRSAVVTRNLVYRHVEGSDEVSVYNVYTELMTMHPGLLRDNGENRTGSINLPYLDIFGDRDVVGLANANGAQLWFFNPDFTPSHWEWNEL